jgi:oligoendopeptidase F
VTSQPPAWDLSTLLPDGESGALARANQAVALAEGFARDHQGRVAGYDAGRLAATLSELEQIHSVLILADGYASFRFDADSEPPEHGALLSAVQARAAQVQTLVNFFDLEWLEISDQRAEVLLAASELNRYAHLLVTLRRTRPHRLTEPEERMLTEKTVTGREAWRRLSEEQLAGLEAEWEGEPTELAEVEGRLDSADRSERRAAADAITAALEPGLRLRAAMLNVLLADQAVDDRLRRYPHWLAQCNLENEADDASVHALVESVVARYDIPRRWAQLKARALGLKRLSVYDTSAPLGNVPEQVSWTEARGLVLAAYGSFSPELANHAERFFSGRHIDAAIRPGKDTGAYCAHTGPDGHPFLLMNFAGRRRDVLTLAHELGHGLHYVLAGQQGLLQMDTPDTVCETASVFGETLTFAYLMEREPDPAARLGLLAGQLDDAVATVFRQIAIHRFEDRIHNERREAGELSPERFGQHWLAVIDELYGDTVEPVHGYARWWSWITHVFTMPGYVYAYAYGQLLALSIYARYLEQGPEFVPRYLELLRAGGSRSPEELGQIVGVDLSAPQFWNTGLQIIDGQLAQAERALEAVSG